MPATNRNPRIHQTLAIFTLCLCLTPNTHAVDSPLHPPTINLNHSPHAIMRSPGLSEVQWTHGFWADRYTTNREVSLRKLWELLADPEQGHVLDNMRIAAGLTKGDYAGTNWQDAWLYKWIEAAACIQHDSPDPWIAQRMDQAIALIARAQQPDGYIASQIIATQKPRFQDPREHEVYVMGHLLTAACVHHRMTGKDTLLKTAIKTADFLTRVIGKTVPPHFAHNPSAVMGLVELYRETGVKKYLETAKRIVDQRGAKPRRNGLFANTPGIAGTDLIQDRTPLRKSFQVVGHNVFFTYLYAGASDIFLENGDKTLKEPLRRLWTDLVKHKMSINGGVSPMGKGISNSQPVTEAVGPPYFLPNADSYNETCGQIGAFMWNYRMLCADPNPAYADIMERELYNGFLAGVGLKGDSWFYRNSLKMHSGDHAGNQHNYAQQRGHPGRKAICCPSNLLRTIAQLKGYLYGIGDNQLWLHHYGANTLDTKLNDGQRLALTQQTDYPWDGQIKITIDHANPRHPLTLRLRIPQWANGATATVNGKPIQATPKSGSYLPIQRAWKKGDVIQLTLPMQPRLMQAHPKAEQLRNQVAVMRGPILYCLESTDLTQQQNIDDIYIPSNTTFNVSPTNKLPFGTQLITAQALHRPEKNWTNELYRPLTPTPTQPIQINLIPYFTWANRGPSSMTVWLPLVLNN